MGTNRPSSPVRHYDSLSSVLTGETAGWILTHAVDLAEHFFTRTRWDRSLKVVRGFPDSEMPAHPLTPNPRLANP